MERHLKNNIKMGGILVKFTVGKSISAFLACVLLAATFTGCNAKAPAASSSTATPTGPKVTVSIWTQNRSDATYVTPAIDNYNKTNKDNVTIDYKMYTDNFQQALDMAFASDSPPDLVSESGYMAVFTKYVTQGKYIAIDKYMTAAQTTEYKALKMTGINAYDGHFYYLPVLGTTGRLFYNKDIFSKVGITAPPTTITEMTADAKKITDQLGKSNGVYGFAMNLKSPSSALQRSLDFMVERSGGPESGFDFKAGQYDFSFYAPFMEQFKTIFTTGIAFPGCESLDIDPLRTQFAAGKIGMYISWSHADPGVYANQFPTTQNWGVAQVPTSTSKVYSQAIQPYGGLLITKDSKNYDADWAVLKNLFYDDNFVIGYAQAGLASALPATLQAKVKTPDLLKGKEEDLLGKNDKLWPATPDALNSQAVVIEGLDQYSTFMQMIYGKINIDTGLTDLTKRYNDAYQKGISAGKGTKVQYSSFDPANPSTGTSK